MPDKAAQDDAPKQLLIGDRLRAAREATAIPLEKIASDLLLDPSVLEHLEAEEFAELGAPVFVRGHLRKYAMRLGLPADELVELYHRDHDRPQGLPIVNESLAFSQKKRRGWLLALLLLIAVAAIAIFLLKGGPTERADEPAESPQSDEEAVLETPPVVAGTLLASSDSQQSQPEPTAGAEPAPAAAKPEPEVTKAALPKPELPAVTSTPAADEPAASATILPDVLAVAFSFSQDSWIEVYDATGAQLLYAMGRAGSTRNVSGEPPLRVFVGLVGAVEVRVGGEVFAIPAQRIRGNVARFVIEGRNLGNALAGEAS